MKIIPAVDILEGKVVRLFKGSFHEKKEYSNDPVSMAQFWQDEGAQYLHVVDLDGAKLGAPKNAEVIGGIIKNLSIPVEVGGGIRTAEHIELYLKFGVDRIALGTAATEKGFVFLDNSIIKENSRKIAISIEVSSIGFSDTAHNAEWDVQVLINIPTLFDKMVSTGIRYLNYTYRAKDGTLVGLSDGDIESLSSFLSTIGDKDIKIIYAGGIASLNDIKKLAQLKTSNLEGVIIGKALYEKRFTLKEAQEIANVS